MLIFFFKLQVCLHCCSVRCSRYVNEHGLLHSASNDGHVVCLSLADLSVWCHACGEYVDAGGDDDVWAAADAAHKAKFGGQPMPRRNKEQGGGGPTILMQ